MASPSFWYRPGKGPLVPVQPVVKRLGGSLICCRVTKTNHPWYETGHHLDLELDEIVTKAGKPVSEARVKFALERDNA